MGKRYQVFVSSTYGDLREERQEVMQALLELDCIPAGMELFPAADDDQWTLIKRVIDDCDYYMVIIAGRYGSIGPDGKSYTQMEYEYAVTKGKPVIGFLHADPDNIHSEKTDPEHHAQLIAFREIVQRKVCKFWSTPQELGSVVSRSVVKLIKDRPATGWVRADRVMDDSTAQEILRLKQRLEEAEAKVAMMETAGPPGTEDLAQGDETISLHFTGEKDQKRNAVESFAFAWNELLGLLGTYLLEPVTEDILEEILQQAARNKAKDSGFGFFQPVVRREDFQRVVLQFRALGIIDIADPRDVNGIKYRRWVLTPYGDRIMSRSAAIRSGKSAASKEADQG